MLEEVKMPKTGLTMEEGTIVRWLKTAGERVSKGEILLEIESDKATLEVECEYSGVLERIVAGEGQTVAALQTIAYIREDVQKPTETRNEGWTRTD